VCGNSSTDFSFAGDLAMFNLAIDSKLPGCDVVARKVEDVAPNGYSVDRETALHRNHRRQPAESM
jgi:hypothetical protein